MTGDAGATVSDPVAAKAAMHDRIAVITGATGVLGRVVAARLARAGARIALVGREEGRLRSVASDLGLADDRWLAVSGELDEKGSAAIVDAVIARYGRIDVTVHLVGGYAGGSTVAETDPGELSRMLDQHVWTTLHLARAAAPAMVQGGWGRLIGVTSPFGFNPPGKNAAYAAAKAAQLSLILSLAQEFRGTGVTANAIVVRTIDTAHERATEPSASNARWTEPEEIASLIAWLCTDEASQVNGAQIPMFGGPTPG